MMLNKLLSIKAMESAMYELGIPDEKDFQSITEFFDYASEKLITRDYDYGFRGHSDSDWELETTLSRFVNEIQSHYPERSANYERELLTDLCLQRLHKQFKNNLITNNDLPQDRIEKIDLWQYGQHFGLPSPLLDWTHSPFIALFFAISEPVKTGADSSRCVWVINLNMLTHVNNQVIEEVRPKYENSISPESALNQQFPISEIVQEFNENNRRIAFQQGFFTKHEYYKSLEVWLKRVVGEMSFHKGDAPVLTKLTFPCSEKERMSMLDRLDKMNINNRTLFPDIFGSVKGAVDTVYRSFQAPKVRGFAFSQD
jgi:hypothetical protein